MKVRTKKSAEHSLNPPPPPLSNGIPSYGSKRYDQEVLKSLQTPEQQPLAVIQMRAGAKG